MAISATASFRRQTTRCLSASILLLAGNVVWATELVYQPLNPSFGGNPAYGSYLLNSAQMQDTTEDPNARDPFSSLGDKSDLENFKEMLNRQILSLIARRIVNESFGEDTGVGEGGTYVAEGFSINILTDNPDALVVNITDTTTGEETVIEIPYF